MCIHIYIYIYIYNCIHTYIYTYRQRGEIQAPRQLGVFMLLCLMLSTHLPLALPAA